MKFATVMKIARSKSFYVWNKCVNDYIDSISLTFFGIIVAVQPRPRAIFDLIFTIGIAIENQICKCEVKLCTDITWARKHSANFMKIR